MNVFGVANHSPDFVLVHLVKKKKVSESDIAFVSSSTRLPRKSNIKYFIFLGDLALRRNLARLPKLKNSVGIVCAPPIKLNDYSGIIPLDFEESDSPHIEAFVLKENLKLKDLYKMKGSPVFEPVDYAMVVQDKVESFTGILTPFMTFIYTMPSSTHQKPIKELACRWLVQGGSKPSLEKALAKLTLGVHMTDKQKERFLGLLFSESALAYKEALQEAKQHSIDSMEFREIADKHAVSAYEMRYMISVVKTALGL